MGLTINNTSAEIRQYRNNEELERLEYVHLMHMLMTEK